MGRLKQVFATFLLPEVGVSTYLWDFTRKNKNQLCALSAHHLEKYPKQNYPYLKDLNPCFHSEESSFFIHGDSSPFIPVHSHSKRFVFATSLLLADFKSLSPIRVQFSQALAPWLQITSKVQFFLGRAEGFARRFLINLEGFIVARYLSGWVKVYRRLIGTDISKNPVRFSLFVHLLSMANIEDSWVEWGSKPRLCPRGSLVTSLRELADFIGADKGSVERQLKYLALRDTIVVESETRGTFITIKNFSDYQDVETKTRQKRDKTRDTVADTPADTVADSNEEIKNKERRSRSARAHESATAEIFDSEFGPIPHLAKSKVNLFLSALNTVRKSVQEMWCDVWEPDFVRNVGEKCVVKRIASGAGRDEPWEETITAWLFSEKNQVLKKSPTKYWEPPAPAADEGESIDQTMKRYGATSFLDLMEKIKAERRQAS